MSDLVAYWALPEDEDMPTNPQVVDNTHLKGVAYMDVPDGYFGANLATQAPANARLTVNNNVTPATGSPRLVCSMSQTALSNGAWRFIARFDIEVSIADSDSFSVRVIFKGTPIATAPEMDSWSTFDYTRDGSNSGGN